MGKKDDDSEKPEAHIFRRPIQDKATRKVSALPSLIRRSERPDGGKAEKVDEEEAEASGADDLRETVKSRRATPDGESAQGVDDGQRTREMELADVDGLRATVKSTRATPSGADEEKEPEEGDPKEQDELSATDDSGFVDELEIDDGGLFDDAFDDLFDD